MANHRKHKSKRKGSSCWLCKPHKRRAFKGTRDAQSLQERRAREAERQGEPEPERKEPAPKDRP